MKITEIIVRLEAIRNRYNGNAMTPIDNIEFHEITIVNGNERGLKLGARKPDGNLSFISSVTPSGFEDYINETT